MWQGQESANYPFSQHFGNPSKRPTVTQSLLKAGLLSQRFLAVAALTLRAHYPLVYWGKNKSPAAMTKTSFFLKKGSTVENCPTLMRIPNVSWRPTKLEKWGKQWEAAGSRPCHPALALAKLGFLGRTSLCSVHSTPALARTTYSLLSLSRINSPLLFAGRMAIYPSTSAFSKSFGKLFMRSVCRCLWAVILDEYHSQNTGENLCSGTAYSQFLFGSENNAQTCTRHRTALTTLHKSQELLC